MLGRCAGPLQNEFENAVYLEAEISRVTERCCGEYIGYDGYRLRRDVRVGLVRVGYADGAFLSTHNDAVERPAACAAQRPNLAARGQNAQRERGRKASSRHREDRNESYAA